MEQQGDLFGGFAPVGKPVWVDALFVMESRVAAAFAVGARAENGHRWCHLWSDDLMELHRMAMKIGLKREWFQDREGFPHYDLTPGMRAAALKAGAREGDLREWLKDKRAKS